MTVKKLTTIENGRLVPTDLPVDADLLEVSKLEGNKIQVKEDGLYFKERLVKDGLEYTGEYLGIEDYSIDLKKIAKTSSAASSLEVTPETVQSLEEHLANLYGFVQRLKAEVTGNVNNSLQTLNTNYANLQSKLLNDYYTKTSIDTSLSNKVNNVTLGSYSTTLNTNATIDSKISAYDSNIASNKYRLKSDPIPVTTLYKSSGIYTTSPKIFTGIATANSSGEWSIDYTSAGFTEIPAVFATGVSVGTASGDRRFATINFEQPTLNSCSGKLASAASAGLLAAMLLVSAEGTVQVIAIGR